MKVANIIIAHKNPHQVERLARQFPADLFHNFIHIDRRSTLASYKKLLNLPNTTVLADRKKLVWAGYGFVDVTLDAIRLAKKSGQRFFYYNLISGMDFPIKPTTEFYHYLRSAYSTNQREFFEILDLCVWPGAHRYKRYHLCDWNIKGRYFLERIINKFVEPRQFYYGKMVPFGRSAWFTATDDFINYCLNYIENNPGFIRFLKTTWSPDEFIFNTLVMNSPFRENLGPNYLRFIDWSEGLVSPMVFTEKDTATLLSSDRFLARKFDETIDQIVIEKMEEVITQKATNF